MKKDCEDKYFILFSAMGKNCKFLANWSEKDDEQGYKVREWATKAQSSDNEAYCKVCMCNIDVS